MNKTVNINIGGLFFHIDEMAYQKLARYFDAIKRSLSNSSGKDEIMKDIEMRVAELFAERQKSDKHVINLNDVDQVVIIMGQPEDYRIDQDENQNMAQNFTTTGRKKLYRDKEKGSIAGVCTGLGYYLGVDSAWIKILFLATAFAGFGFGIVIYIILWAATPEAITTSEKIEMTGEPVTISNIEKKVREEFDSVSNKLKNVDYNKIGNQFKTTSENVGSKAGSFFISIFGVFAKIIGAIITMFAAISFLGICIASIILLFSSSLPKTTIFNYIRTPIGIETPLWIQGILFLLAFGIPFFFLLILGLKLLVPTIKSINNVAKYALLGLWIVAIGILATVGINEATQLAYDGKDVKKESLVLAANDTLFVKFKNNDFYSNDTYNHDDFKLTTDQNDKEIIYSNNVSIEVLYTDEANLYFQVNKNAVGKSSKEAKNRAEKIKYNYKIEGNNLIFDNYFITDVNYKFRNQHITIYLYLPKGTLFKMDKSVQDFDESDSSFFNLHYSSADYTYQVGKTKVMCLDCPVSENEYNDIQVDETINDTTNTNSSLKVGKDGIIIKTTNNDNKSNTNIEEIKLNKNGISIKTK